MAKVTDRKKRLHKQKVRRKIKLCSFAFFCLFLLGTIIWTTFFSSIFKIKQIILSGEDPNDTTTFINFVNTTIESRSWLGLKPYFKPWLTKFSYNNKNSLFQDFASLEDGFKANFPQYSGSQINFNWWKQTLTVVVSERVSIALWCNDSQCGLVDKNGVYFKELGISDKQILLSDPIYANYPLLEGQLKEVPSPVSIGSLIVSPEIMTSLETWYNSCKGSVIAFREIFLNESSLECFSTKTALNTKLTFNLQGDVNKILLVIENLQSKTKAKPTWQGLASINFCFYPKIYYTPDSFFSF